MDTLAIQVIILLIAGQCNGSEVRSLACYGSQTVSCTRHNLTCGANKRMYITNASYVTEYKHNCSNGTPPCNNDSLKLNSTHKSFQPFNYSVLYDLCTSCSTEHQCIFEAPKQDNLTFSTINYHCEEEGTNRREVLNVTCDSRVAIKKLTVTVGGAVGGLCVIAVFVAPLILFIRRRNRNKENTDSEVTKREKGGSGRTRSVNKYTSNLPSHSNKAFNSGGDVQPSSNYDTVENDDHTVGADAITFHGGNKSQGVPDAKKTSTNMYFELEPTSFLKGKDSEYNYTEIDPAKMKTVSFEDDGAYNHLGDQERVQTQSLGGQIDYNHLTTISNISIEGDYDSEYNHLDAVPKEKTLANDYDTTDSVQQALKNLTLKL